MKDFTEFKKAKALIVGGAGFIGSNLARRLVGLGAGVTIADNMASEYGGNLFNIADIKDDVGFSIFDVRDQDRVQEAVKAQDYLFNLVGQTSHLDSMQDPYADLEINCRAQLSILEACRRCNKKIKIIFASTRQIYGRPSYLPVDERHALSPVDINGVNKMSGEWYHIIYDNVYGIRSCILRLTNTYGPRMRIKDARQTFVGIWINNLLQGSPLEVWGGGQLRDFTYVDDAVGALLSAAADGRAYGKIFNLGGDCVISLKELAELLIDIEGKGDFVICPFPQERKDIDIGDYYSEFKKIGDILGWKPAVSLREGLTRTLDFYRRHLKEYI